MTIDGFNPMPMTQEFARDTEARGIEIPGGEAFIVSGGRIALERMLAPADDTARIRLVAVRNWPQFDGDQLKPWVSIADKDQQGQVRFRNRAVEARTRTIISVPEMEELFGDLQELEFPEDHRDIAFDQELNVQVARYAAATVRARYFHELETDRLPGGVFIPR